MGTSADAGTLQDEGAAAILLGGILGGPFSAYSEYKENQALRNLVETTESRWGDVLNAKTAADATLIDDVKAVYEEFGTVDTLDDKGKPTGVKVPNLINPATGQKQVSKENLWNIIVNSIRNVGFINEGVFSDASSDPHWAMWNSTMGMGSWVWNLMSKGVTADEISDILEFGIKEMEGVPEGLDIANMLKESSEELVSLAKLYDEAKKNTQSIEDFEDTHLNNRFNRTMHRLEFYTRLKDLALNKMSLSEITNEDARDQITAMIEDNNNLRKDLKNNRKALKKDFEKAIGTIESLADQRVALEQEYRDTEDDAKKAELKKKLDTASFRAMEKISIEGFEEIEQAKKKDGSHVLDQFAEPLYTGLPSRRSVGANKAQPLRRKSFYKRGKQAEVLNDIEQVLNPNLTMYSGDDQQGPEIPSNKLGPIDTDKLDEIHKTLTGNPELVSPEIKKQLDGDSPIGQTLGKLLEDAQKKVQELEKLENELYSKMDLENLPAVQEQKEEAEAAEKLVRAYQSKLTDILNLPEVKDTRIGRSENQKLMSQFLFEEFLSAFENVFQTINNPSNLETFGNKALLDSASQALLQAKNAYNTRDDITDKFREQILKILNGEYTDALETLQEAYQKNEANRAAKQIRVSNFLANVMKPVFEQMDESEIAELLTEHIEPVLGTKLGLVKPMTDKGVFHVYEIIMAHWVAQATDDQKRALTQTLKDIRLRFKAKLSQTYPKTRMENETIRTNVRGFISNPQKYFTDLLTFLVGAENLGLEKNPDIYELLQQKDIIGFIQKTEDANYDNIEGVVRGTQDIPTKTIVKDIIELYKNLLAVRLLEESLEAEANPRDLIIAQSDAYKHLNKGKAPDQTVAPTYEQQMSIFQALNFLLGKVVGKKGGNVFFLEGSPGTGKTQVVTKYILESFKRLVKKKNPKFYAIGHTKRSTDNINRSLFGKENNSSLEDLANKDLKDIDVLIIDEAPAFLPGTMEKLLERVKEHNAKGSHKVRILAFGDPAQITRSPFIPINHAKSEDTTIANPLTVVYRTSVAAVTDFFMNFRNQGKKLDRVKTITSHDFDSAIQDGSAPFGVIGVSGPKSVQKLASRASDRSRVIVVQDEAAVSKYKEDLPEGSDVEVIPYDRIGGVEFDEVYIDINPDRIPSTLDYNKAMFTAASRATKFVAVVGSIADATINPSIAKAVDSAKEDFARNAQMFEEAVDDMEKVHKTLRDGKVPTAPKKTEPKRDEKKPVTPEQSLPEDKEELEEEIIQEEEERAEEPEQDETPTPPEPKPSNVVKEKGKITFSLNFPTNDNLSFFGKFDDATGKTSYSYEGVPIKVVAVQRPGKTNMDPITTYAVVAEVRPGTYTLVGVLGDKDFKDPDIGPTLTKLIKDYEESTSSKGIRPHKLPFRAPDTFFWSEDHDANTVFAGTMAKGTTKLSYYYERGTNARYNLDSAKELVVSKFNQSAGTNFDPKDVTTSIGIFSEKSKDVEDKWNASRWRAAYPKFTPKLGVPYMMIEIPGHTPQLVRLQRNAAVSTPELNNFIDAITYMETSLPNNSFGGTPFRDLITSYKDAAFQPDSRGEYTIEMRDDFVMEDWWATAVGIIPEIEANITSSQHKEDFLKNLDTVARGIFGVTKSRLIFDTREEAQAFIDSQEKGRFVIDRDFKSEKRFAISEVVDDLGNTSKYRIRQVIAGKGPVQRLLNGLALSNKNLSELHIRVQKKVKGRSYWTGKSLLATKDSKRNFYTALRGVYNRDIPRAKELAAAAGVDISQIPDKMPSAEDDGEGLIKYMLDQIYQLTNGKYGLSTAEFDEMELLYTSEPITSRHLRNLQENLNAGKYGIPLHRNYFNDLGSRWDSDLEAEEEIASMVYSNLEDVQPTNVRITVETEVEAPVAPEQETPTKERTVEQIVNETIDSLDSPEKLIPFVEKYAPRLATTLNKIFSIPIFASQLEQLRIRIVEGKLSTSSKAVAAINAIPVKKTKGINYEFVFSRENLVRRATGLKRLLQNEVLGYDRVEEYIATTVAHELGHVATSFPLMLEANSNLAENEEVRNASRNFLRRIEEFIEIVKDFKKTNPDQWDAAVSAASTMYPLSGSPSYGLSLPAEFLTMIFTDEAFKYILEQIPYEGAEPRSIWERFVEAVADLFNTLLNNPSKNVATAAIAEMLEFYSSIEVAPNYKRQPKKAGPEQQVPVQELFDKIVAIDSATEDEKQLAEFILNDTKMSEEAKVEELEGLLQDINSRLGLFWDTELAGEYKGDLMSVDEAVAYAESIVPGISKTSDKGGIRFIAQMLLQTYKNPRRAKQIWGYVYKNAVIGTVSKEGVDHVYDRVLKHELMHYVYTYLTSPYQKQRLRKQAAKQYGAYLMDVSEREFNEFLARTWQVWEPKGIEQKKGIFNRVLRFIRDVAKMVGIARRYHTTLDEFFSNVHQGYYSNKYYSDVTLSAPLEYSFITEIFGSVNVYRQAKQYLTDRFNYYKEKGKRLGNDRYPMTKEEIYFKVRGELEGQIAELTNNYNKMQIQYEQLKNAPKSLEQQKGLVSLRNNLTNIDSTLGYLEGMLEQDTTTRNSVYYAMVQIIYPNWTLPREENLDTYRDVSLITVLEDLEKDQLESTSALREHIIDSEQLDQKRRMSDVVKDFTNSIYYYKRNKETGVEEKTYLTPGFAYRKLLDIFQTLDISNIDVEKFEKQWDNVMKFTPVSAAVEAIRDKLYELVSDATMYIPGSGHTALVVEQRAKDAHPTYHFLYDKTATRDFSTVSTLDEAVEIQKANPEDVNIISVQGYYLSDLVQAINKSGDIWIAPTTFFDIYKRSEARNLLAELHTLFASQKETELYIADMSNEYGKKKINYIRAKDLGIHTNIKREIRMSLMRTEELLQLKRSNIKEFFRDSGWNHIESKLMRPETAEEGVREFLSSKLQLTNYAKHLVIKDPTAAATLIRKFVEDIVEGYGVTREEDLIIDNAVRLDEDGNPVKVKITVTLPELLADQNGRLNELSSILTQSTELTRATNVRDAENKTIYKFNNGNYVWDQIKAFAKGKATKFVKGATGRITQAFDNHLNTRFFRKNIFVNGLNHIHSQVVYHDAFRDSDRNFTKPYSQENDRDRIAREFVAAFTDVAGNTGNRYNQFFYPPSDRSKVFSAEVGLLTVPKMKAGIKQALEQFAETDSHHSNYKNFDKNKGKFINFRVVEDVLKEQDKDFEDYRGDMGTLADLVYQKLSDYAIELRDELVKNRVDLPQNILRVQAKLSYGENQYLDTEAAMKAVAKAEGIRVPTWNPSEADLKDKKWVNGRVQYVAPVNQLMPLIDAYIKNSYINGFFLNQLATGDNRFYKGEDDIVKRMSGPSAPGQRGLVSEVFGLSEEYTVAILGDEEIGEADIDRLLEEFLTPDEIVGVKRFFETAYETTDAQGFVLPRRMQQIRKGFGRNYNMGGVIKPVHFENREQWIPTQTFESIETAQKFVNEGQGEFRVNPNDPMMIDRLVTVPYYAKYSAVELSDDLVDNFKGLKRLRDMMEEAEVDEVIMASGIKVGEPVNKITISEFMAGNALPKYSKMKLKNKNYRLQLNPASSPEASVTIYSQLMYFLNVLGKNQVQSTRVYNAVAALIEKGVQRLETDFKQGFRGVVKKALEGPSSQRASYLYNSGISHNNPVIEQKIVAALASVIERYTTKIKFPGGKLVLQSAYGISKYDKSALPAKDIRRGERLRYIKENGRFYAEVILPRELLTKEQIAAIDKGESMYLLKDMFGFRIPSTELHSGVPMKVVGTYDARGTNVVIAPKEIVALHGSDYDVDSLFVVRPATARKNIEIYDFAAANAAVDNFEDMYPGDLESNKMLYIAEEAPIGYEKVSVKGEKGRKWAFKPESLEEVEVLLEQARDWLEAANQDNRRIRYYLKKNVATLERVKEDMLKNLITDTMLEVMSHRVNFDRMLTPISLKDLKKVIEEFGLEVDDNLDLNRFKTRAKAYSLVQTGQKLVGVFANNIKSLAYMLNAGVSEEASKTRQELKGTLARIEDLKTEMQTYNATSTDAVEKLASLSKQGPEVSAEVQELNEIIKSNDAAAKMTKQKINELHKSKRALIKQFSEQVKASKGKKNIPTIDPDLAFEMKLEGGQLAVFDRIAEFDPFGNQIWQVLDALVNAATDNVKELILAKLNLTEKTGNIASALIGLGVPFRSVISILNQPFMKILDNMDQFEGKIKGARGLQEAFAKKYKELTGKVLTDEIEKRGLVLSDDAIHPTIGKEIALENMTPEQLEQQYLAIDIYRKGRTLGENLKMMSSFLNIVREMPTTVEGMERIMNYFEQIFGRKEAVLEGFESAAVTGDYNSVANQLDQISQMVEPTGAFKYYIPNFFAVNPHIGSAMKAFTKLRNIIKNNFDVHSEEFMEALEGLPGMEFDTIDLSSAEPESYAARDKVLKRRELVKYLTSNIYAEELKGLEEEVLPSYGRPKVLRAASAFSHDFAKKVWALKRLDSDLAAENPDKYTPNQFLQHISVEKNPVTNVMYMRFTKGASLTEDEYVELEQDFHRLKYFSAEKGATGFWSASLLKAHQVTKKDFNDIQEEFVKYSVLNFGFSFSASSFAAVLPPSVYKTLDTKITDATSDFVKDPAKRDKVREHFAVSMLSLHADKIKAWPVPELMELQPSGKTQVINVKGTLTEVEDHAGVIEAAILNEEGVTYLTKVYYDKLYKSQTGTAPRFIRLGRGKDSELAIRVATWNPTKDPGIVYAAYQRTGKSKENIYEPYKGSENYHIDDYFNASELSLSVTDHTKDKHTLARNMEGMEGEQVWIYDAGNPTRSERRQVTIDKVTKLESGQYEIEVTPYDAPSATFNSVAAFLNDVTNTTNGLNCK